MDLSAVASTLPEYLHDFERLKILKEIKTRYPNVDYYISSSDTDIWQSDGWSQLECFDFFHQKLRTVYGLILSNSCDIAPDNSRLYEAHITFSILITCEAYKQFLEEKGVSHVKISSHLESIRKQEVTNRFYLPPRAPHDAEYIALLDEVYSMPRKIFLQKHARRRHLRLSQAGFYIFIMKLSCHYCRMAEGIKRDGCLIAP